jgi:hypothetical protein
MSRAVRWIAAPLLLAGLALPVPPARAQDEFAVEGEAGGEASGTPIYGYLLASFLIAGGIFVLCKTARR